MQVLKPRVASQDSRPVAKAESSSSASVGGLQAILEKMVEGEAERNRRVEDFSRRRELLLREHQVEVNRHNARMAKLADEEARERETSRTLSEIAPEMKGLLEKMRLAQKGSEGPSSSRSTEEGARRKSTPSAKTSGGHESPQSETSGDRKSPQRKSREPATSKATHSGDATEVMDIDEANGAGPSTRNLVESPEGRMAGGIDPHNPFGTYPLTADGEEDYPLRGPPL